MTKKLLAAFLFLLFFSGTSPYTIEGYKPVYVPKEEAKEVKLLGPRDVVTQGKIYIKDQYIYVGDVNLGIHILTAFFLFMTVSNLYQSPRLRGESYNRIFFIALQICSLCFIMIVMTNSKLFIIGCILPRYSFA